jgi:chromosome segregation protein
LTAFEDIEKERDTLKIDIDNLNKIQIEYNLNQKYHDQEMVEKATKIKEQGIGLAEMEKLLQSKAEEIGNILMTLNSKQSELVTTIQNLEMVQTQNLQQGEENQRLSQMLNKDESHSQFLLANEQIQSLKCENENLQQQNRTFEKKADQLTLEYNAIELKLSENENKLSEDTETILILNSSKSDLEEIISQLKCDKQNLETKLNALSEELLSLKAAFDSEKQSIEHKLHYSVSQLAEAQSEHQSLTSINNDIQQKYADQTEFYESLKNKFNNLDGEYARSTNELENVHIQLKNSEAKLVECKVDLNESAAVIKNLTDQCQNFQNTNNALQSQLDANSTELEEKAKSIKLLEEQNTNSDLELSNVRSQIDELTLSSMSLEDSRNFMNESNTTKVFELQNTIAEKESEISHLKVEVQELEDESKNNGSKETQMPHDIQEFHTTIRAKENQIQEIKEALDELKLEYEALNAQKERLTNETEIEINACMNTIASNEEAINIMKSELENEQARKLIELTEMKEEIETTKNKNEDLSNQIQTEKKNSLILQQNYNQLLANSEMNDSTKELINERDKAVKKSTLLTDKCKKLITKCKQQENQIKGQEKEVETNLEAIKLEIDKTKAELETKSTTLDAVILERQNFEDANNKVTEEMKLLQEKLSHSDFEKKTVDEKWETEMMEKDLVIEDLRNQMKEKESTIQHSAKNALSEMQERIDFLEEAYEAQGNDKSNAEEQVEKVKEKLVRLTSERSELYETQISLKEELSDLKKENSRLSASLENTKREIGKIRQTNIVSQMLDSPLLQAVAQEDQSLQTEKDSKDKKDEDQKNLEVGDNVSATKIPKEDIEEVFRDNDSFSGFDNNDNGNGGWDNEQIDIDEFEEDVKFVDEKSSIKLTDPKLAPSVIDINFEKHENKSLDVNDEAGEGWGGWDDEELDLGSNTEVEEVKNVQEHESVAQENESSIPPVFHTTRAMLPANTMPILSHDDPPASLISNVSGWGDDDGFGWGNEEDLPGNLRLSAERDMVEMKDEKAQKEDTPSKDVETATHNLPLVGSTEGKYHTHHSYASRPRVGLIVPSWHN